MWDLAHSGQYDAPHPPTHSQREMYGRLVPESGQYCAVMGLAQLGHLGMASSAAFLVASAASKAALLALAAATSLSSFASRASNVLILPTRNAVNFNL